MLAAVAVALTSGCDAVGALGNDDVSDSLTPEQAKSQVIDAAKSAVTVLDLEPIKAVLWLASCNDQGDAPFRGRMRISYPLAATPDASGTQIAEMVRRLQDAGWSTPTDFATHGSALRKDGVVLAFEPQSVADTTRGIQVYGECRDVTTTKGNEGPDEDVALTPR